MIRMAVVGLGKMGMSHMSIINAHPDVKLAAVCDKTTYVLDMLNKYTGVRCYTDVQKLLENEELDAVCIATPTRFHVEVARAALERGLHVFCEKPLSLSLSEGELLADMAERKGLVNQVGYHYRFVGAFHEMKRLLDAEVIGEVHHVRAEAYGPVVLRPKGSTWRTNKTEGGGCLYDYACHAIDLVNYMVGSPDAVGGTVLNKVFSRDVEDEVYSTLFFADGKTGQIAANWSDESHRKMSTRITVWGKNGRIAADRQEVQVFLREGPNEAQGLEKGWNVRYAPELAKEVWFDLRGEEYSAQIAHFVQSIKAGCQATRSTFRSATEVERVVAMLIHDAQSRGAGLPLTAAEDARADRKARRGGAIRKFLG